LGETIGETFRHDVERDGGDDRDGLRHFVRGEDTVRGGHDDVHLEIDEFPRQLLFFALFGPPPERELKIPPLDIAEIGEPGAESRQPAAGFFRASVRRAQIGRN
jgi:hypothetical protein